MIISNKELLTEKFCQKKRDLYINKFTFLPEENYMSYDVSSFSPLINFLCKVTINVEDFADANTLEPNDVWYLKFIEEFQRKSFIELKSKKINIAKKIKINKTVDVEVDESKLITESFFSFLNTVGDKSFLDKFYFQDKEEIDIGEVEITHNERGLPVFVNRNNPFVYHKLLMRAEKKTFNNYSDNERMRFYFSLMGELLFETYLRLKNLEPDLQKIGISSIGLTPLVVSKSGLIIQRGVIVKYIKKYK